MEVKTADYKSDNASQVFTDSLISTGFAVLKNHPIPVSLIFDVYYEWKAFFASSAKFDYQFTVEDQTGYFPFDISETAKGHIYKDLKEFYAYYDWSKLPPQLSPKTHQLFKSLLSLASEMLSWIEKHTPNEISQKLSMPLSSMIENSRKNMLRIIHYPPVSDLDVKGAVRAAPHEDINLLTLLPASAKPGLQVLDLQGNWHDVQSDAGTIVVNTGDMLQMATDGFYKSTTHRVMNPSGADTNVSRYSMPFFLHPRPDVRLSASYTAGEYWYERLVELGLKPEKQ